MSIDALIELQIHKLILVSSLPATFSRYFPYQGFKNPTPVRVWLLKSFSMIKKIHSGGRKGGITQ